MIIIIIMLVWREQASPAGPSRLDFRVTEALISRTCSLTALTTSGSDIREVSSGFWDAKSTE